MNKFKTSKFLISFLFVLLIVTVLLFSMASGWFVSSGSNLISIFDRVIAVPFSFLSEQKEGMSDLLNTYKENEVLKGELYNISEKAAAADSLQVENKQLRQLLDLKDSDTNEVKVVAEVISRSPSSWNKDLTVDKGSADNITDSMLVVSNGGLIGSVTDVADGSSIVSLLTNDKSTAKISVRIQTKSGLIYGIITGYDAEKSAYVVSQLNRSEEIKEGDSVVTSGLGAYNAENLPVGKVLSVSESKDQLNKEVLVQPAADLSDLRAVMLVRN
ncbi:rod shape-determining protein MreC [Streptococcus panodentis]|uniref:Cell shape-determining protein MreC n=1 Tax=Streptococcus panodentis TaxID=1581472 RepID=A0ABS5AWV9_9STRE|nr:rod shape-determining protein MreC [Streptococcus panodentis]MBP2620946.1 rod shape-determining protein MreC [Streptococcus panodentis]